MLIPQFIYSVEKQHKLENDWLKKYKYIPDGFALCILEDRCVLRPCKKLSRTDWFNVPDVGNSSLRQQVRIR